MESTQHLEQLEAFFKALADANRLKIIGLLAQQPMSVEQIAEVVSLSSSTVSHHLSKLSKIGLVSAKADGYYSIYQLEIEALEAMSKRLLAQETLPAVTQGVDMDAYNRKVLNSYLSPEGKLKGIPAQKKKLEVVLMHIVETFEMGKRYPEKEVNELLLKFHDDTAHLRRSLIEFHLMERESSGGSYWRV